MRFFKNAYPDIPGIVFYFIPSSTTVDRFLMRPFLPRISISSDLDFNCIRIINLLLYEWASLGRFDSGIKL